MSAGSQQALAATAIGACAALISLLRLWLGNPDALTEVIWAEDGVFPLCVEKAGFWTCVVDPFAGYLLMLPRLVAGVVAALPVEAWPITTNLIAAGFAGLAAAFAFALARRFGLGWVSSAVIGLLPVIAPVVGLEAINALGSSYMLLLYVATLALVLLPRGVERRWPQVAGIGLLLLMTALTIPTAAVLLAVITVQAVRRVIAPRAALAWTVALAIGLLAQWYTAANAAKPRVISVSSESVDAWANSIPDTILTYWPGLRLGSYDFFGVFPVAPLSWTGVLAALAIVVGGLVLVIRGGERRVAIGLLLLTGIVVGAVPAVIGGVNNRYFVVPLLLWGAALMVALDPVIRRSRPWVVALVAALVLAVWWPSIPASWFRTMPAPPWSAEVARVEAKCKSDPGFTERIIFSPYWPPNGGETLSEPTQQTLPCLVVWKWMPADG